MNQFEREELEQEYFARNDYFQEAFGAEANAIAEAEEAQAFCDQVEYIYEKLDIPLPRYLDPESLRAEMLSLHPNRPLYVALETLLN